ncbi:hypothetical protein FRC00_000267 [Tulasnella sp. 408]|nr:hypothetical protein FRC00_000267 [Tulasnella sp. 408]
MTSGVSELEALLLTPNLSFPSSSSANDSTENAPQYITAARESLKPRRLLANSSCSCAGENLSKKIDLINNEVREGTSQIRELVQSIVELKKEVMDLRSALAASKSVAGSESIPRVAAHNVVPTTAASTTGGDSYINPRTKRPSKTKNVLAVPRVTAPSSSPASFAVAVPTQASVPEAALVKPLFYSKPSSLIAAATSATPAPKAPAAPSEAKPKSCTCQPAPSLAKQKEPVAATNCKACSSTNGDTMETKDVRASENLRQEEPHSKPPVIATAFEYFSSYNTGELNLKPKDKITILDSPNTPVGWMYGEIVETRRGIFPARHVRELPHQDLKEILQNGRGSEESETAERPPSPLITTALRQFVTCKQGELSLDRGDTITILESPDTPIAWMYGEIVKKRQGIFPSRYVTLQKG